MEKITISVSKKRRSIPKGSSNFYYTKQVVTISTHKGKKVSKTTHELIK
jgi:hypothetical protein